MSSFNLKKFDTSKKLEELWNSSEKKLMILVIEGKDLNAESKSFDPYISLGLAGAKNSQPQKTTIKSDTKNPLWGEFFFFAVEPECKVLEVKLMDHNRLVKNQTVSKVNIQLDDLKIEEVNNNIYPLESGGTLQLRLILSSFPESRPKNPPDHVYYHNEHMDRLKTGDLIIFSGIGLFPSLVKLSTNSPFSHVGIVVKSPNKYTQKLELYIVEVLRNCDKLTCAFQDQQGPHSGLNIFRFEERLYQFHGTQIWYCPLHEELSRDKERLLVDYIWGSIDKDLTPPSNQNDFIGKIAQFMEGMKWSYGKESDLIDLVSASFMTQCLVACGVLPELTKASGVMPRECLSYDSHDKPILLRAMDQNILSLLDTDEKQFALEYYLIKVKQARNLAKKDRATESDAYCLVIYMNSAFKHIISIPSNTLWNTKEPVWNESFAIRCVQEKSDYKIVVDVRDSDLLGFDRLGYVKLSTSELRRVKKFEKWVPLSPKDVSEEGEILLEMELHNQNEAAELCNAVKNNDMTKVKEMIETQNADVNLHSGGRLYTPLRKYIWQLTSLDIAVATKNIEMIKYLIEKGADVNRRNGDGNTPLHLTFGVRGEIAEKGANPNLKNARGDPPSV